MCGIVGFYSRSRFDALSGGLPAAVAALTHRGPDDAGQFLDAQAGVGLGHRRLSILDLSAAGRQPMADETRRCRIVYNGEIYNFKEIREHLASRGYAFCSHSDTEVALKAYQHWGEGCVSHFAGMFSLAVWDGEKNRLFLARDPLGVKPLYWSLDQHAFRFASELKALMALPLFARTVDWDALALFLHYQYVPAPRTIFHDTWKLLPGHYLVYDGHEVRCHPYWEDAAAPPAPCPTSAADLLEELEHILSASVAGCQVSDVPVGMLLSGGVDSSVVAALMQRIHPRPIQTFSIGFAESGFDEAPWAARVARHLGTDHTEHYVTPAEARQVIGKLPEIYDEPFADASAIPTYWVSRVAAGRVKVALSGDGGDEQFGGYVRYWTARGIEQAFRRLPAKLRTQLARAMAALPPGWVEAGYRPLRDYLPQRFQAVNFLSKWESLVRLMPHGELAEIYRMLVCLWPIEDLQRLIGRQPPPSQYEALFQETAGWPALARLMRVDRGTYLPDAMLTKVDRASMAVGLEIRVPLLDHRLVAFTAGLPDSFLYRHGKGKYLLEELLARYLPRELFDRPKSGFGVPIEHWLRQELKPLLLDYLSPARLKREGVFKAALVEAQVKAHLAGEANHQYRLWALLMWEMWRERWL